jgi:hypothetical protein
MSETRFGNDPGGQHLGDAACESRSAMRRMSELADDAKSQAASLAHDAAQQVKTQAGKLADGAKTAVSDAEDKLRSTAEEKKNAGADFVSDLAGAVRRAAGAFDEQIPQAGDYIRQAAEQIDGASDALRSRNVNQLVEGVQDFARRQPTAFLGITVLAGFAAVRFLKSSTSSSVHLSQGGSRAGSMPSISTRSENARHLGGENIGLGRDRGL